VSSNSALHIRIPKELANARIPGHIAIIMDGNGRWAKQRGRLRVFGHNKGADTVDAITEESAKLGVKQLTLYAFSSENWKRPKREIEALMKLLKQYLVDKRPKIMRNNIRLTTIGKTGDLPEDVRGELARSMEVSSTNTGMKLCLALSYGGRGEIVDACRRFARDVADGLRKPEDLDERLLQAYMYDPKMEPPDLLIRTGGDLRISNFLLWHISYTELYVTPTLWPEFSVKELYAAILDYSKRERRFGEVRDIE
jgi:undecaprenyl diphosphate synthase